MLSSIITVLPYKVEKRNRKQISAIHYLCSFRLNSPSIGIKRTSEMHALNVSRQFLYLLKRFFKMTKIFIFIFLKNVLRANLLLGFRHTSVISPKRLHLAYVKLTNGLQNIPIFVSNPSLSKRFLSRERTTKK